jgi:hypothetical protein
MAFYAGVAITANVINQHRRRNNVYRSGGTSLEDTSIALRLNSVEIDLVIAEYCLWRRAQFGINANYNRSSARMVSFLAYIARGVRLQQQCFTIVSQTSCELDTTSTKQLLRLLREITIRFSNFKSSI